MAALLRLRAGGALAAVAIVAVLAVVGCSDREKLEISGLPAEVVAGEAYEVTVTARNVYGRVFTSYAGTVRFSSTDTEADLPDDATLGGGGRRTFEGVVFRTSGPQTLTVVDTERALRRASARTHVEALQAVAPGSALGVTSERLTLGTGARAVIHVALEDDEGAALSGADVAFVTTGASVEWVEQGAVESTARPGTYYRTLIAPEAGASTTVEVMAGIDGGTPVALAGTVTVHYEPAFGDGGMGTGGARPRGGNLRVRVTDEAGAPIEGAFVMVGAAEDPAAFHDDFERVLGDLDPAAANTAWTDALGDARFVDYGAALAGPAMVTAGAEGHAYVTLVDVGAADIALALPETSPETFRVRLQGGVLPPPPTDGSIAYPESPDDAIALALVQRTFDVGQLAAFHPRRTLIAEDDVAVTLGGTSFCSGVEVPVPGNVHVPAQTVTAGEQEEEEDVCTVEEGNDPWSLHLPEEAFVDLFALHAILDGEALAEGVDLETDSDSEILVKALGAMELRSIGVRAGVPAHADQENQDIELTHPLTPTMVVTVEDAPSGVLLAAAAADLYGEAGAGRLLLQGVAAELLEDAEGPTGLTATLTTADATGALTDKHDLALAIATEPAGAQRSFRIDRTALDRHSPRSLGGFFAYPEGSVDGLTFSWTDVVREGVSPDRWHLSRSVLQRETPRGEHNLDVEPFWVVYAPAGVREVTLPALPAAAPRAGDEGLLLPDPDPAPGEEQALAWELDLIYLGAAPDPDGFDLDRHAFEDTARFLTHQASLRLTDASDP